MKYISKNKVIIIDTNNNKTRCVTQIKMNK